MVSLQPPACDFGLPAPEFSLVGVDGRTYTLADCVGENGLLVMFICNHCPYVKSIKERLVRDVNALMAQGIGAVAIMSNDTDSYPDDSYENMQRIAQEWEFKFPYLYDETQAVAKAYNAVCTPDFFGYNNQLELQYRGRLDASRKDTAPDDAPRELFNAMFQVAQTGQGPVQQTPSMGCSIKWK